FKKVLLRIFASSAPLLICFSSFAEPPKVPQNLILSSPPEHRVEKPFVYLPEHEMTKSVIATREEERTAPTVDEQGRIFYAVYLKDGAEKAYMGRAPSDMVHLETEKPQVRNLVAAMEK